MALKGWGPWSEKEGVYHVQPPLSLLNARVAFRIHLDDSNEESGCLSIIPSSHKHGILSSSDINRYVNAYTPLTCIAKLGNAPTFIARIE
ncbi:phytanoyl-CoA dioxygenase family protein [Teredinibacter purpureus]|uniref:phytanoyl-CoA dioxygenase family protein n=1 Tax=Teredinibacter purpureus TaxID=2731756 RepID=UPI0009E2D65B